LFYTAAYKFKHNY